MLERNENNEPVWFKKTKAEKLAAKAARNGNKHQFGNSMPPVNEGGVKHKLSIFVQNKERSNTFKTTHSFNCVQDEISNITELIERKYTITKVIYNGKVISK